MRGFELTQARTRRVAELRRELADALHHSVCLDTPDLLARAAAGDVTSLGNHTKRRLVVKALVAERYSAEQIAAAWGMTPEQIAADLAAPLVDPDGRAAAIPARVNAELVETPEPDRYVEPSGRFA